VKENKPLLLTVGMGIGAEIAQQVACEYMGAERVIFLGRKEVLPDLPLVTLSEGGRLGCIAFSDGEQAAEVEAIEYAARMCLSNKALAMTTGPINKKRLAEKGFSFMGHTDFLGSICGVDPVMAFTGGDLKVALVTTHIPLMSVSKALNIQNITHTVKTASAHLRRDLGFSQPRFAVCGLNPHAGEEGLLGEEELKLIHPCCDLLRKEGLDVIGAVSAETAFLLAQRKEVDMVIAMYHDQGLAPLKAVDFGRSVNWTLGLPIIRTSVDHGTAESIVGTGKADHRSLLAAMELAVQIARRHQVLID
jgi:4-hydroxythreonine-4-phosphate dehydrogenase